MALGLSRVQPRSAQALLVGSSGCSASSESLWAARISFKRRNLGLLLKKSKLSSQRGQFPPDVFPPWKMSSSRTRVGLQAGAGGPRQNHTILFLLLSAATLQRHVSINCAVSRVAHSEARGEQSLVPESPGSSRKFQGAGGALLQSQSSSSARVTQHLSFLSR